MKTRATLLLSMVLFGLTSSFWLYGGGRTMRETVKFDMTATLTGLAFGVFLPLVFILPLLHIAKKFWPREKQHLVLSRLLVFAAALLVGSLTSEVWILRDEAQFSVEVSKTNKEAPYSRARTWPNQTCSLVFLPGRGIHSTD